MKKTLFILFIVYCNSAVSQTQKFSVALNYPIPLGKNFITNNYIGIVDAEARYYPYRLKNLRLGVCADIGLLTNSAAFISKYSVDNPNLTPVSTLLIKPGLTAEMEFGRFAPNAGIGYSFFNFMSKNIPANEDTTTDGLNLNLGLKYNLFQHFFLNVNFDYTRCRIEGGIPDISYNRDIFLLRAGVGYNF